MIWFLTIPVIFFLTFKNVIESDLMWINGASNGDFLEWVSAIFVALLLSCLISLVPVGIALLIGSIPKTKGVTLKEYDLMSLFEKDGISGRFFLGIGSIDGIEYYFWYRRNKDNSISGGKTERSEDVQIYETDKKPKMITYQTDYKNKYVKYFIWLIGVDKRGSTNCWNPDFCIPKGSIKEGYSL